MKLLTLLLFVLTSASFGQGIVYHRPEPPCSEQLKKASIQGVFIGDSKEQVTSDFPSTEWLKDAVDGTLIGLVNRGLDNFVTSMIVTVFNNKVYKIDATYSSDLKWKDNSEMADAVSKAWAIPEIWVDKGPVAGREIACKERIAIAGEPRHLTLIDAAADNELNGSLKRAEEDKKKKFKP